MTPFSHPELFDHVVVDGTRSPGVVTLDGHERAHKWDNKDGSGQDGATSELKGAPLGSFTMTFDLVNDPQTGNQIAEWETFQPILERSINGTTPIALPIEHPDLTRNRYTSIVLVSIGGMVHDGMGGARVVVKVQEHRPPKPKGGTAKGGSKKGGPDPNADAKAQLDALLDEAKK